MNRADSHQEEHHAASPPPPLGPGWGAATSAIALSDAVTHGVTGGYSPFSDKSDLSTLVLLGVVVHGLAYLAFVVVLVRESGRFRTTNRVARGSRLLIVGSLVLLAAGFLTVGSLTAVRDAYDGTVYAVFGVIAGAGFGGLLLGSLVLGLALLPSSALGTGARVLALVLPVMIATTLLSWLSPIWAHPAYPETVVYFGLALLGVGADRSQPVSQDTIASPTSMI